MENLDSDLLRTFVAVAEAGSVTDGAARIHRSQSATSLQIKRLENILGHPVFERHGRGVVLTETGRRLLPVANEVTDRLDSALRDISQSVIQGKLRLGIPDDHGKARLAEIVARFTRLHPQVELEVTCALSTGFPKALERGQMDLAVYEVEHPSPGEEVLFEDPTRWVSSATRDFSDADTLPVALFDHACWWRDAAIRSLKARGRPYRVIYSSQSVSGVTAAVKAGVAVGLLGKASLERGLSVMAASHGFGPTPPSKLVLAHGSGSGRAPLAAMADVIRAAFMASADRTDSQSN
ncbi:LysR family transcriptional regulator [Roseobacter sp. YSTF-M11]|uniref:LysR family transcriptional regulator n=1 Tax=Roseobacter insulae TaxID=2859783 RepID=A0A9X1K1H3_9RHOB|nr:LysR substrate-binding domain-containing protein [Roseobacter insulae]MBW4709214.1 LysR family transcriptional regulator [Roseobacter insulae]